MMGRELSVLEYEGSEVYGYEVTKWCVGCYSDAVFMNHLKREFSIAVQCPKGVFAVR